MRILVRGIFGSFFFENKHGEADRYRAMLNEFLFTKIENEDIGNSWFQQDSATCHTAKATLNVLLPVFKDHIISRRIDVVWPPRSCDLTPLADKPEKIYALKDNIRKVIGEGYCMASRGSHLNEIIFHN